MTALAFWVTPDERETLIVPEGQAAISQWDTLIMGSQTWPGICRIEVSKELDVDVAKKTKRQANGSLPDPTLTDKGYQPARLKATLILWERSQWDQLTKILPEFVPRKGSTARDALDIFHPATAILGVETVIVTDVSVKQPTDQQLTVELSLVEWFPATAVEKKAVRSNGGADASTAGIPGPDGAANL